MADLGNNVRIAIAELWRRRTRRDFDPRHIDPRWHHYDDPATQRLVGLERFAGRRHPSPNSLRARLPLRFFWRYAYPYGRGGGVFPVLEIWPMAVNTARFDARTFDYALGPRVIMPQGRMGQTWSETAQNSELSTPSQQLTEHATGLGSLDDVWTSTQAPRTNDDSTNTFSASSNQVANPFTSFLNAPPALGQPINQPLTFEELDEYNFLLNDQTDITDHLVTDSTTHARPFSPPTRPLSSRSWSSNETSLFGSTTQPTYHRNGGLVDLTADSSPPLMPVQAGQRNTPRLQASRDISDSPSNPAKRRKTATGAVRVGATLEPQPRTKVEEVDLRDIDDDTGLSQLLQKQREITIKAQQEQEGKPTNLANLQCIICMEPMVNITATHCGHLFCHTCLMEALIAGEQQGDGGKQNSKCPVCRKKVQRDKDYKEVIPLEINFMTKGTLAQSKGKAKVAEE